MKISSCNTSQSRGFYLIPINYGVSDLASISELTEHINQTLGNLSAVRINSYHKSRMGGILDKEILIIKVY